MLRLAAGGFRAMTRLSGRSAGIWPDICVENRDAIVEVLDRYLAELGRARDLVQAAERGPLLDFFEQARAEGHSLPARSTGVGPLVELSAVDGRQPDPAHQRDAEQAEEEREEETDSALFVKNSAKCLVIAGSLA